ncbi:MAG: hypothetical protein M1457_05215, partial [bacterium]|nr:hypothetical protein [bacterium]
MSDWAGQITGKLRKLPQWIAWRGIPVTPSGVQMVFNRRRLAALRDRHRGRRCFVIGNGPSLTLADLERLRGDVTIAANKIYLAFPRVAWRPTYLVVIDEVTAANNRRDLRAQRLAKLYSWEAAALLLPDPRAGKKLG